MNILVYSANITRIERLSKLLNQTHTSPLMLFKTGKVLLIVFAKKILNYALLMAVRTV